MKKLLVSVLVTCVTSLAVAKLPALSDEAKAKAAEAAAKSAWASKVDNYLLCKSQDKVAASYYQATNAAGKSTKPATVVPPCADPGAFVYEPPVEAKPIEAASKTEIVIFMISYFLWEGIERGVPLLREYRAILAHQSA